MLVGDFFVFFNSEDDSEEALLTSGLLTENSLFLITEDGKYIIME